MQGILLVDKPSGWTSFDVVNYVRRIVAAEEGKKPKNCKVGHTGTLDPAATGLLVLLVGKDYTKKAGELTKLDKTYEVTMKLGEVSSTGDSEGVIAPYSTVAQQPSSKEVREALEAFLGEIEQVPPAFSAIKVSGKRAYDLARAGKEVKLEARKVHIRSLTLKAYKFPYIHFVTEVSSGTYIRSLVEDIGKKLETGAYMSDLRRTTVGPYAIGDSTEVATLDASALHAKLQSL